MPLLGALFTSLFSALGLFLAKMFAAKLAIRIIAVTALTALSTGLVAAFNTQMVPLVQAAFSTQYGQFIGLAFPPIAGTCLTTITTLWVACTTYRMQARAIALTANV